MKVVIPMNETIYTILNRCSLRKFDERKIKKEHLENIIESMKRAPTAGNQMLYSIILVTDQEKLEQLSESCDNQPFIKSAPLAMIIVADQQKWTDYYLHNNVKGYCARMGLEYKSPQLGDLFIAIEDAMIAAQNGVIAAESQGIGSCYIGDIMEHYEFHKKLLNLPDYVFPIAMLVFGYYPEGYKKVFRPRFDNQYFVFENEYKKLNQIQIKEMFKQADAAYHPNNSFKADNFAQMFYARKTNSDFMMEMTRSISEMLKNWSGKNKQ